MAGVALIAFGLAWETIGFVSSEPSSVAAKWANLWGFWGNLLGCLWSGFSGAQDLLFKTKLNNPHALRHDRHEMVLHVLLKSQGLASCVGAGMMLNRFTTTLLAA